MSERIKSNKLQITIGFVMAALALTVLGFAFANIGSPGHNRLLAIDQHRVQDLNNLTECLRQGWQNTKDLPVSLNAQSLTPNCTWLDIGQSLTDPVTQQPYGYSRASASAFSVCATFALPSADDQPPYIARPIYPASMAESWQHHIGRFCFNRDFAKESLPKPPPVSGN